MSTQTSVLLSTVSEASRHSICLNCIREIYPEALENVTSLNYGDEYQQNPAVEFCCYCGWAHKSGLYIETEATDMLCNGIHRQVPQDMAEPLPVPPAFNKQLLSIIGGVVAMCVVACIIAAWLAITVR